MLLAGVYLLYTGYKLCKDVLDGVNGSSWGFFAAGVGFLIVGVVMLVVGGRDLMKKDKAKRAAEAAAAGADPETAGTCRREEIYEHRTEMRHLADGLDNENGDDTDAQEEQCLPLEKRNAEG